MDPIYWYICLLINQSRAVSNFAKIPRPVAEPELPELDFSVLAAVARPKTNRRPQIESRLAKPASANV
jgi:hypothetical protein